MCGIVGGLTPNIALGVDALYHRGPDARGAITIGKVSLGHTRLSIIDVDARSNQPFQYGRVTLVLNGEIWNYQELRAQLQAKGKVFTTEGDTEVLAAMLDEYHLDALPQLQGMFAIAWTYDGEVLWLARDRFGETPLHVSFEQPFRFASETKALLLMGCHPKSIQDLPPGCHLRVDTNEKHAPCTMTVWYRPPIKPQPISLEEAAPQLYRHLMWGTMERTISDVPVCTLLSGGIDSAATAYFLKQRYPNLVAYTAVFDTKSQDLRSAREVADMLNIELREIPIPPPTAEGCVDVIRHIEMPYKAQVEIGWPCLQLARAMQADGFKVTYSGEGSDELWASYGFAYHALQTENWHSYRRDLFLTQARKNFMRCNKIFMAHGIECRLPFLNTGLVEFALSLPQNAVADGRQKPKAVLQRAFAGKLPDRITRRPKMAFQDGLGIKKVYERVAADPQRFYKAEHARLFT